MSVQGDVIEIGGMCRKMAIIKLHVPASSASPCARYYASAAIVGRAHVETAQRACPGEKYIYLRVA